MKKLLIAGLMVAAGTSTAVIAQVKPRITNNHVSTIASSNPGAPAATRVRVLGATPKPTAAVSEPSSSPQNASRPYRRVSPALVDRTASSVALKSTIPNAGSNSKTLSASPTTPTNASHAPLTALTQLYRVGVGDILDIQISENPGRSSTLFTVQDGGMLDYPLAGGAVAVSGMTTAEVAHVLKQHIKYFSNPTVLVKVRDYSSHSVTVNGFVVSPGQKILRREAVPLYVVLSEAMPLPEASQAVIIRKGRAPIVIKLADTNSASTLVLAGDLIRVSSDFAVPTEFFFAGGAVNSPGQKAFHTGLTLTQAILASGGLTKNAATTVRLSRQLSNGRLVVTEYDLALIQNGKEPDPALQNGDRIEVRLR